jgi:hypothetical protein
VLDLRLTRGAERFAALHAAELPQKDEFCGAFCALLALRTAGAVDAGVDQDGVADRAGTLVTRGGDPGALPPGEPGRRDYRLALRAIEDPARAGTTAAGVVRAIGELSGGSLTAVPLRGQWSAAAVTALLDAAARATQPLTLIANIATERLWGARCPPQAWLEHLATGALDGPPPDWDAGHFVCLLGAVRGPAGALAIVADTYPSLGWHGIHLQPVELLAVALQRPGRAPGGIVAVAAEADVAAVRAAAAAAGLAEAAWDNGTAS